MKKFLLAALVLTFTVTASAAIKRHYQDIKLPSQSVLERQSFGAPVVAASADLKSAFAGNTSSAAVVLTSFLASVDVPRNLVITPGGSTGDVAACTIVVAGKNILGVSITEDFAFSANASSATTGAKAFKSIDSVTFPAACEDSPYAATWSIGSGEKIGLNRCLDNAGDWAWSLVAGAYESTRATVTADADEVEKNVADFNGTMNGSSAFIGYFVQNFRCNP